MCVFVSVYNVGTHDVLCGNCSFIVSCSYNWYKITEYSLVDCIASDNAEWFCEMSVRYMPILNLEKNKLCV